MRRIAELRQANGNPNELKPLPKTAHIIATLKRPEEVDCLRRIYGGGFFVVGLSPTRAEQDEYFRQREMTEMAEHLKGLDQEEKEMFGQRTRDTFQLADVFLSTVGVEKQIERFLDLVFGHPHITPTAEEHAMFLAFAASLQSGDLARQVGAALVDESGDLLAVGCNEAPKAFGGHYGPELGAHRDIEEGLDSNDEEKRKIIQRLIEALKLEGGYDAIRQKLKSTGLTDLTEFGRSVHAEMQALLSCARTGRSTRGTTLYTTTWPCHNCCRQVLAAGVKRVVYVEPYPKSKAEMLHGDAISADGEEGERRVPFVPFLGLGREGFSTCFRYG